MHWILLDFANRSKSYCDLSLFRFDIPLLQRIQKNLNDRADVQVERELPKSAIDGTILLQREVSVQICASNSSVSKFSIL
jgi:hypothetical protein